MRGYCMVALVIGCAVANAQETHGDWTVNSGSGNSSWMGTTNESSTTLVKKCVEGSCVWHLVATSPPCSKDSRSQGVPVLVSGRDSVITADSYCNGQLQPSGLYDFIIGNPDAIDTLITGNDQVAIAIAIEGLQFRVFRISTRAGAEAMRALQRVDAALPRTAKDSTL